MESSLRTAFSLRLRCLSTPAASSMNARRSSGRDSRISFSLPSAHRSALGHPQFDTTVVTRAFSGRYARGLANDFTRMLDHIAPLCYPEVNQMTSPIRRAAVELEDPHGTNL